MDKKFKIQRFIYYIQSFLMIVAAMKPGTRWRFFLDCIPGVSPVKRIHLRNPDLLFSCLTIVDILVVKEVIVDREYETYGVHITGRDEVIVDIGAGFGDFAILYAKQNPKAKVYAFEPDAKYFSLLKESVRINNVPNVKIYKTAVRNIADIIRLTGPIDVLKIDTEGAEYAILRKNTLSALKKVKKMTIEYHPSVHGSVESLRDTLKTAGFTVGIYPQKFVPGIGHLTALRKK